MRKIACFLLLCGGLAIATAAETWRWKDANGVVHYSDMPVPGAERVDLRSAPKPGTVVPPTPPPSAAPEPASQPEVVPYTRCVISSPTQDLVVFNVDTVGVALDLQPPLQGDHRIQMLLNGKAVSTWPADAANFMLTEMHRGSYTLTARVTDASGRQLCVSPTINFHLRQATVAPPRATPR